MIVSNLLNVILFALLVVPGWIEGTDSTTTASDTSVCGAQSIRCLDDKSYQTCKWYLWLYVKYSSDVYVCDDGTVCDQENGPCVNVTVTTTVATETTTPSCGSYDAYCLNSTTYQTCSSFLFWTTLTYYTCDNGTYCDESSDTYCANITTTTTSVATASTCGDKGIFCLTDETYQTCWWFLWWVKYGTEYLSCDDGTVCDQDYGDTPCISTNTTTTASSNLEVMCKLPEERGYCRAFITRWRYNWTLGRCEEFIFGGCEGNDNNFYNNKTCMNVCSGVR